MNLNTSKSFYFQNLDGLRAIAALCVIFAHMAYWFKYPSNAFYESYKYITSMDGVAGRMGVVFFFILSGFLITYLLFLEEEKNGKINVLFFYVRRVLRIWPLYFATIIVGFVIYPIVIKSTGVFYHENASGWMFSFFLTNFDHIYRAFPTSNILGVHWSVAVEEQFYLLWPLIFIGFSKRNYFKYIFLFIILFSELFFLLVYHKLNAGDYHFFSCIKYLSFGALMAYFCYFNKKQIIGLLMKLSKPVIIVMYIVGITLLFMQSFLTELSEVYDYLFDILPALFFAFVIVEQNFSDNSFYKIGRFKFLTWLGKISYGLYLTHMIALNIVIWFFTNGEEYVLLKCALTLILTILISFISYQTLEKYFLSLKDKFSFFINKTN